jgi:hypothetical protein
MLREELCNFMCPLILAFIANSQVDLLNNLLVFEYFKIPTALIY